MRQRARSLALVAVAAAGCSGAAPPAPSALADGSPARPPPVSLEGFDGATVATRVRVLTRESASRSARTASCLGSSVAPGTVVIERIGVSGASVTILGPKGRELRACDSVTVRVSKGLAWCGHAFARLDAGRLGDPRLSLSCRDADGQTLGFAWLEPRAGVSYVVVARAGYDEVYSVAAGLPVRVTTDDVDLEGASAAFPVSEHARDGRRLRAYELGARVSG